MRRAQSTLEYILLITLVLTILSLFLTNRLGSRVNALMDDARNVIVDAMNRFGIPE